MGKTDDQRKYLVAITEKEAEHLGYDRYLRESWRKPVLMMTILFVVAFGGLFIQETVASTVVFATGLIGIGIVGIGWTIRANKIGQRFAGDVKDGKAR